MTKSFIWLLAITVVLGVVIGGAFSGGIALGKTQGGETAFAHEPDPFRQQSQGQFGQGDLTGVIEKVAGNAVTINTIRGSSLATLEVDTTIWQFAEGVPEDLKPGMQITVVGQGEPDGTIIARSVLLNPADAYSFFDRGHLSGVSQPPAPTSEGSGDGNQGHSPLWGGGSNFFFGGGPGHGPTSRGSGTGSGQHSP